MKDKDDTTAIELPDLEVPTEGDAQGGLMKADFSEGEWYIRHTVIDVPPATYAS